MKYFICIFLIILSLDAKPQERAAWLKQAKFGVMTHYLADWLSKTESLNIDIAKWNQLINNLNADTLAGQVKAVGAGYMIFTIGQNSGFYDSPNNAYDTFVGKPGKCSKRDLIADLGVALHKRGLKLIVYLPSGAPNGDPVAKKALEWQNGPYPNKNFQKKWEQVISEWSVRWGDKVDGWWFDGCYRPNIMYRSVDAPNFKTFAQAARSGNPASIVAFNMGVIYRLISGTPYEDYIAGEINKDDLVTINHPYDGKIDGAQIHALSNLGEKWGMGHPRFTTEQIINYTKKINDAGGAMTWDAPIQSTGLIYPEFIVQLKAIGQSIEKKGNN